MNESLKNEIAVREYLLGRVADERELERFEELLFGDDEFCSLAEIAEDALINDFVLGRLNERDRADFVKTLDLDRDRRSKVAVTREIAARAPETASEQSFWDSVRAFLTRPAVVASFAILVIAAIGLFIVFRGGKPDELADLRSVYSKERPIESRISGFEYAPLVVTRGAAEEREKNRLRIMENNLLSAVEREPNDASGHHALGVFYLTQRKFDDAVRELESATKLDPKNSQYLSDLSSGYLEKGRTEPNEKKLETLARALDAAARAIELDQASLPALFNKGLSLQELRLFDEARKAWNKYLELDPLSAWADEARKNLERIGASAAKSHTADEIFSDFMDAFRANDSERVWLINSDTREIVSGIWLPYQLTRRLIDARSRSDDGESGELIRAITFIGDLEKARNADFFVSELAAEYSRAGRTNEIVAAQKAFDKGLALIRSKDIAASVSEFKASRGLFAKAGINAERLFADFWVAQMLTDLGRISESDMILDWLSAECTRRGYRWLGMASAEWSANNRIFENDYSKSIASVEAVRRTAAELSDSAFKLKSAIALSERYRELGESRRALSYLAEVALQGNPYHRTNLARWRIAIYTSSALDGIGIPRAAEEFAVEALATAREGELKNSQVIDDTVRRLMQIKRSVGDYPEAMRFAEESIRMAEATADEALRGRLIQITTIEMAETNREFRHFREALDGYSRVVEMNNRNPEVQIDDYLAAKGRLLCLLALGRNDEAEPEFQRTFELAEKYRSKIVDSESRNEFFKNDQVVYDAAVENAFRLGDSERALENLELSKARTLLDFVNDGTSVDEIERRFPDVSKPLPIGEIRRRLPDSTRLVEFSVQTERTYVWIVGRESVETVVLPLGRDTIGNLTDELLSSVRNRNAPAEAVREASTAAFERIIAPVIERIPADARIVFIPDKALYQLPFAALFSAKLGRYLIESRTISLAPSANVFVRTSEIAAVRAKLPENALVVGNPQFDRQANPDLVDLPSAESESKTVAGYLPGAALKIGSDATRREIVGRLPSAGVFHFAGHYVVNDSSAPNSRLLLSKTEDNDGSLRVSELANLRLSKSKLVVLSACDTSGERVVDGEGATGIAQTFLAIGAPVVVAGGWKVDSVATSELMTVFHENRRRGVIPADALRQAQIGLINGSGEFAAPYFWAAFTSIGGFER
jgi:CHAT domain-containing protein/Tfp pilus assembly protein PilF